MTTERVMFKEFQQQFFFVRVKCFDQIFCFVGTGTIYFCSDSRAELRYVLHVEYEAS